MKVKVTLPKKKEIYKSLKDELEKLNVLASITLIRLLMTLTKEKLEEEKGKASLRKPKLKMVMLGLNQR